MSAAVLLSWWRRQELDAVRDDLDCVPLVAVRVFPRAAPQASVNTDLTPLREVVGAELRLLVPGRDADEVGLILARPIHRQQEVRDLSVVPDVAQLDVRGQIADQRDDVHSYLLC